MLKDIVQKSEKIISFWIKAYTYVVVIMLIGILAMQTVPSSFTSIFFILLIVFIVLIIMSIQKGMQIANLLKDFERLINENPLKEYLKKMRLSLVFSIFLDIFPFSWIFTFLLKVYFYHIFNGFKNYLDIGKDLTKT